MSKPSKPSKLFGRTVITAVLLLVCSLTVVARAQDATGLPTAQAPTCIEASVLEAEKASSAALQSQITAGITLVKDLGAEIATARGTIVDLQRTIERKKNDETMHSSLLKNCELDKTVITESLTKYKDKIAKLEREIEALKKGASTPKCPPCPTCTSCPTCTVCSTCPTCPKEKPVPCQCAPGEINHAVEINSETCPPFWTATNTTGLSTQACTAYFIQESHKTALQAHSWTIDTSHTLYARWLDTGYPALLSFINATQSAALTGNRDLLLPFFHEHVLPPYRAHVQPHVEAAVEHGRQFYAENVAATVQQVQTTATAIYFQHVHGFVQEMVLPWAELIWGMMNLFAYYAVNSIDLEDAPLHAWLAFAKTLRAAQDGAQYLIDAIEGSDALKGALGESAVKALAPLMVHGSALLLLFRLRRVVLGIMSGVLFILLSPVLAVVFLITLPFRKKGKGKKAGFLGGVWRALGLQSKKKVGPAAPDRGHATEHSSQPEQWNAPPVQMRGGLRDPSTTLLPVDGSPMSTQDALNALRSHAAADDL